MLFEGPFLQGYLCLAHQSGKAGHVSPIYLKKIHLVGPRKKSSFIVAPPCGRSFLQRYDWPPPCHFSERPSRYGSVSGFGDPGLIAS